ncbi:pirin family protein [Zunongwangia endophytica]|uniref:Pirin family protein n=1 Tax=Zunongwangia endophytica TaxID=1808945 RepID=A0ABV8HES1_9FLAO|nr:pirin family protein [Zunongwangia endophytica]MDN3596866.1 pirin family protein [Zunongwangia endophytica]
MLTKIDNTIKYGKQRGGFGIQILYPGLVKPELNDSGFSTIGRIDHTRITPGTIIPMHPHKDDEILTYLRSGKVKHKDSEGHIETISNQRLMMMNAGSSFYHQERTLKEDDILEGLQIFLRPQVEGLKPKVQFHRLQNTYSINQWRKIAGKSEAYPMQIRSNTWLMDLRLEKGKEISLPNPPAESCVFLFYVFDGKIEVENKMTLETGESVLIESDRPKFFADETSDILLFITQLDAPYFEGGMYSGNLHH